MDHRPVRWLLLLGAALSWIIAPPAIGGEPLDLTFESDGKVLTDIAGSNRDFAESIGLQPDGKILVAGGTKVGNTPLAAVARYLPSGSLDPSFGGGDGKATTALPGGSFDMALQNDGRIVLVGPSNGDFGVTRLNSDGSIDTGFGHANGFVAIDVLAEDGASAVAVQDDGKIVVAGTSVTHLTVPITSKMAVVRLDPDGHIDESFDDDGIQTVDVGSRAEVTDLLVDGLDRLVLAGRADDQFAVVRLTADGLVDPSFGDSGRVTTSPDDSSQSFGTAAVLQSDGKILIGGTQFTGQSKFLVARIDPSGELDSSFGNEGFTSVPLGQESVGIDLAVQSDGGIVVVGWGCALNADCIPYLAIARFSSGGDLDPSFNGGGRAGVTLGEWSQGRAVVIQPDGRILVAGYGNGFDTDFAIVRLYSRAAVSPGVVRGNKWFLSNDFDDDADIAGFKFGLSTDRPVVGDWDGDGDQTPGVVRSNVWFLTNSAPSGSVQSFGFGKASDLIIAGDWDGDGAWSPGVVRGNVWYLGNELPPTAVETFAFGKASDRAVVGDWDGNGTWTPGVVRGNVWYVSNESPPITVTTFAFGKATDTPIVGDWDGDGTWTAGVMRDFKWFLSESIPPSSANVVFLFGKDGDRPLVGDWDFL